MFLSLTLALPLIYKKKSGTELLRVSKTQEHKCESSCLTRSEGLKNHGGNNLLSLHFYRIQCQVPVSPKTTVGGPAGEHSLHLGTCCLGIHLGSGHAALPYFCAFADAVQPLDPSLSSSNSQFSSMEPSRDV